MPGEIIERDPVQEVEGALIQEFDSRLSREVIASLAEEEVAIFEGARVRSFVSVLALRRARQRARSEFTH